MSITRFPQTRFQGSKRKLLPWLSEHLRPLPGQTVLDVFGGSGSVSYLFKSWGRAVTYNDLLPWNEQVAIALIENRSTRLTEPQITALLAPLPEPSDDVIRRQFAGLFFTDEENHWLDRTVPRISALGDRYQRAIAWYALFQACLRKRPYNLFHRGNLSLRMSAVKRSFGNKVTWDRPFPVHFQEMADEAHAALCDSPAPCVVTRNDALALPSGFDIVYLDPPYMNARGQGVDYGDFYHFLDGLLDYAHWDELIDCRRKHRPLKRPPSGWTDPRQVEQLWCTLCERHAGSVLAISYRSDGYPSPEWLLQLLRRFKPVVTCHDAGPYQYVLSKNRSSRELLFIGR